MPAGGFKIFVDGQVLSANDINDYLMQGILVFANDASRNAGIAGPDHGMMAFSQATNKLSYYDGSDWQIYTALDAAEITSPSPTGSYTGYQYWTFTASGTAVVADQGNGVGGLVDVLVIGGGGAGGEPTGGGGGGAGAYMALSNVYLAAGSHTITVGAGGAGSSTVRNPGNPSSIGDLIVAAGGGASSSDGGSGGGSYRSARKGRAIQGSTRGKDGGDGIPAAGNSRGGGGGGSAGAGGDYTVSLGGAGGIGTASSITGTSVTRAAGGGGGNEGGTGGAGGSGIGGTGGTNAASPTAGTINTGSGGGGCGRDPDTSGSGGSGIVIIRVTV